MMCASQFHLHPVRLCFPAIHNAVNVVYLVGYARLWLNAEAFNSKLVVEALGVLEMINTRPEWWTTN